MPDPRRRRCTCCGKHESEVGPISWRGNCRPCGQVLQAENIIGIHERKGYAHTRRLRGYAKMLAKETLDGPDAAA